MAADDQDAVEHSQRKVRETEENARSSEDASLSPPPMPRRARRRRSRFWRALWRGVDAALDSGFWYDAAGIVHGLVGLVGLLWLAARRHGWALAR